jgi:hypothetical protein
LEEQLEVDTLLVRGVAFKEGALLQFIGELKRDDRDAMTDDEVRELLRSSPCNITRLDFLLLPSAVAIPMAIEH